MATTKKSFPANYSNDSLSIIEKMTFSKGKSVSVAGSMSLRSQQYAGDYDLYEEVKVHYGTDEKAVEELAKGFQHIIRNLMDIHDCYIGDIKAGLIEEWIVINPRAHISGGRVVGYDYEDAKGKLVALNKEGVIDDKEFDEAMGYLKKSPSAEEFLDALKNVRFQVVRWKPQEVLKGFTTLRDGRRYDLVEALGADAICKIDAVALVEELRYTDFSCIYAFYNKGKLLNETNDDVLDGIKQDILYYYSKGNFFKVLKRIFSLLKNKGKSVDSLVEPLNGDLGRIYSLQSDIGTLLFLLENESVLPLKNIQTELNNFRSRLSNIWRTPGFEAVEEKLLSILSKVESGEVRRNELLRSLQRMDEMLDDVLSRGAKVVLGKLGYVPLPKSFKP